MKTELEKLNAGEEYCYEDKTIYNIKENAVKNTFYYNNISPNNRDEQYKHLKKMFGSIGENVQIEKTFSCDNGKNIYIGDNFLGNFNLTILDVREVYIGDNVMIGPNTLITTVGHPLSSKGRRKHLAIAEPVTIKNDVWIGGNVTILPGVTIGENVVIGAGAVVTKDIPDNSLALGVPANVVRKLDNDLD